MKLRNEYLAIIDKENSKGFYSLCKTTARFVEFISNNSDLTIKRNIITFDENTSSFSIKKGEVKGKDQLFYHLVISFDGNSEELDSYKNILRELKRSLHSDNLIIETLRDDLSFYYSNQAYALIHNVENLMRKFITYFMITNVGKDWVEESSPEQIKNALDKSKRKQYIDVLQQLDFVHLGDFLFKSYQEDDISCLFDKIQNMSVDEKININDLKGYLPQSNWDKYFKDTVDCNDLYLKTRWQKIYDLRNKIAHTSYFTEKDHKQITALVNEVTEKLESAFENIDSIDLPENERESLSENIAGNVDENLGKFINEWNKLENYLFSLSENDSNNNFMNLLQELKTDTTIDSHFYETIDKLRIIRNKLVHSFGEDSETRNNLPMYLQMLINLNSDLQASWKDEAITALKKLGGTASLKQIYECIALKTHRILSPSWKSSIRKTIYLYSSDTKIFNGKEDIFQKIDKGVWSLRI